MLGHYRAFYDYDPYVRFLSIFPRGVQLFYVISGFILYRLYIGKINGISDYLRFILKRYLRIAPLFHLVTIINFVVFYRDISNRCLNLVSHFLIIPMGLNRGFINGIIGIEWAIFVEFTFYIVFPFVALLYKRSRYMLLLFALFLSLGQTSLVYFLKYSVEIWQDYHENREVWDMGLSDACYNLR